MARDADKNNQLKGLRLSTLNGSLRIAGKLPKNDFEDLVRLNVSQSSDLKIDVSKVAKGNKVNLEVYTYKKAFNQVVKQIGKTDFRSLTSKQKNANLQRIATGSQSISTTLDNGGEVLLRFFRPSGSGTNFTADISATTIVVPGPNPDPGLPPGPGPGPVPIPVTPLPASNSTTGQLEVGTTEKRYLATLSTAGDYQFNLTGLSADADLQILASNNATVLKTVAIGGTAQERVILPSLQAGSYVLRVSRGTGNAAATNFSLNATLLTDSVSNVQASPQNLGTLSSTLNSTNYVVAGGLSPVDYFSFTTGASRGFARFDLTGPLSGSTPTSLFGDLDIDLYAVSGSNIQTQDTGLTVNSPGFASEVFSGTLDPNTTYNVRVRPKDGTTDGSAYNLKIGFTARNDQPSIVRDIIQGGTSSNASNFTQVGNLAYFTADTLNSQGGQQVSLWLSSGGTLNSTTRLADFAQGTTLKEFTAVGTQLYFTANTVASGTELWTSDGTKVGTKQVVDLNPGAGSSNPTELTAVGNNLFFYSDIPSGSSAPNIQRLYVLKPGVATPQQLTSSLDAEVTGGILKAKFGGTRSFTEVNDDSLYFAATDANNAKELFRASVDGAGNVSLGEMILKNGAGDGSNPTELLEVTDGGTSKLYLIADTTAGFGEVVRIDQFNGGAYDANNFTIFNLNGAGDASASQLTYISQTKQLYFSALNSSTGQELYRVDTVAAPADGTNPVLVKDINSGTSGSNPGKLTNVGGKLVFVANDGTGDASTRDSTNLWVADSTGAYKMSTLTSTNGRPLDNSDGGATPFVTNIADTSDNSPFAVIGDTFFFAGTNTAIGDELRKITLGGTTGSSITTTLVSYDIFTGASGSSPKGMTAVGSLIYFVANSGTDANGNEPWSILG